MLRRIALAAVLLGVAPLAVVAGSHRLAEAWGARGGRALAELARALPASSAAGVATATQREVDSAPAEALEPAAVQAPARAQRPGVKRKAVAKPSPRGVFVSARSVLALANAAMMPQAVPVPPEGQRPAGLRLAGVSRLGVGLRDGDVLTRVAGAPATAVAGVVELVVRARARQSREISAEFWRGGERWSLVVEQPYPDGARSLAATP